MTYTLIGADGKPYESDGARDPRRPSPHQGLRAPRLPGRAALDRARPLRRPPRLLRRRADGDRRRLSALRPLPARRPTGSGRRCPESSPGLDTARARSNRLARLDRGRRQRHREAGIAPARVPGRAARPRASPWRRRSTTRRSPGGSGCRSPRAASSRTGSPPGFPSPKAITVWTRLSGIDRSSKLTVEVATDKGFSKVRRVGRGEGREEPRLHRPPPDQGARARRAVLLPLLHRGQGEPGRASSARPRRPTRRRRSGSASSPARTGTPASTTPRPGWRRRRTSTSSSASATTSTRRAPTRRPAHATPPAPTATATCRRSTSTAQKYRLYQSDKELQDMHAAHPVRLGLGRPRGRGQLRRRRGPRQRRRHPRGSRSRSGARTPTRPSSKRCRRCR